MGKPRKPKGAKSSSGLDAGTLVVGAVLVLGVALAAYLMTGSSPSQPAAPAATAAKKQPSTEIFAEAFELYQKQEWKAAASSFRKYLRLQPTDTSALNNLGLSLTYSGDLDEAIKTLNKIGVDAPNHADAMSNLGIAYNKNRQAEEAIQAYRKALLANPAHVNAGNNLALLPARRVRGGPWPRLAGAASGSRVLSLATRHRSLLPQAAAGEAVPRGC